MQLKKLLIVCILLISCLSGCSNHKHELIEDKKIAKFLTDDLISIEGYEGLSIIDVHKLCEKLDRLKLDKDINYNVSAIEMEDSNIKKQDDEVEFGLLEDVVSLKNNDVVSIKLDFSKGRKIYYGEKKIKVKNLKKLPSHININDGQKELEKIFNKNEIMGLDGQGIILNGYKDYGRMDTKVDNFIPNYFDILYVNGDEFHKEMSNFKNGDIVTLALNDQTVNNLKDQGVTVDNDIVDIKITDLVNKDNIRLGTKMLENIKKYNKVVLDETFLNSEKEKNKAIPLELEGVYLICRNDADEADIIVDTEEKTTEYSFVLLYSMDTNNTKKYYVLNTYNDFIMGIGNSIINETSYPLSYQKELVSYDDLKESKETALRDEASNNELNNVIYVNIWNAKNQPLKHISCN